jgi:hypothetical protein
MKTISGLLWNREDVQSSIRQLKETGVDEDRISVLARNKAVRKFLGGDQSHVVEKHIGWGVLFGIAIFGVSGLTASLCECTLFNYSLASGIGTLASYITIGTIFGAIMGSVVGVGELEKDTHLYTQGVSRGGVLMVMQVSDELASRTMSTLRQTRAVGVKIHPEKKEIKNPPLSSLSNLRGGL